MDAHGYEPALVNQLMDWSRRPTLKFRIRFGNNWVPISPEVLVDIAVHHDDGQVWYLFDDGWVFLIPEPVRD